MSAWPMVEVALHKWLRDSTGVDPVRVMWPAFGRPLPAPPYVAMSVVGDLDFTRSGQPEKRFPQNVSWVATVTAGPGTHSLEVLAAGETDPVASTSVTLPGGTTIPEARDALLAQAILDIPDLDFAASGTSAITVTGTADLRVFHLAPSLTIDLSLAAGPDQVLRVTPGQVVVSIEFGSSATAGDGTARILAAKAKDEMREYEPLLRRAGYRFGALLRDTPSYLDKLTESRHVLDVQLLGFRVSERRPKPWIRTTRVALATPSITSTVILQE
jgi:hypothetical protein